jgi:hypothetical protein
MCASGSNITDSRPLLTDDELVRPTEKDFRWKVPTWFAAEGTG